MPSNLDEILFEAIGDAHESFSATTPFRADAFEKSDEEKIEIISNHVRGILETLGMDLTDDSLQGTPNRVAKLYVNEAFGGLHPKRKPSMSTFENITGMMRCSWRKILWCIQPVSITFYRL